MLPRHLLILGLCCAEITSVGFADDRTTADLVAISAFALN